MKCSILNSGFPWERYFSFSSVRKIQKVLNAINSLSKVDNYFYSALEEFINASNDNKINMLHYALKIYDDASNANMDIETAVLLSAYEAN